MRHRSGVQEIGGQNERAGKDRDFCGTIKADQNQHHGKEVNVTTVDNYTLTVELFSPVICVHQLIFAVYFILHPQQSLICCNEELFSHTYTLTHSVNLTCQEGNSVIRMSRSLDMNPKTVGSVQSNQVIKLII